MLPKYRSRRKLALVIIIFALTLLACLITDIVVNTCSTIWLIAEINVANGNPDTDTIDLDPGCVYEFDEPDNYEIDQVRVGEIINENALPIISSPIVIRGKYERSAAKIPSGHYGWLP